MKQTVIQGKNIVLGVCGGIAAYKSVELLRLLIKGGARVRVILTRNAQEFVGPRTFEALSGQPVCTSLFERESEVSIKHIEWAQEADAVVIAPATANILAKLAHGIADDALTTLMLAVTSPVMICPSMNTRMYQNGIVQRNLEILKANGYSIIEPGSGELACGTAGPGRLPEPSEIFDRLIAGLTSKDLKNKRIVITAGPTREPIDPVRFISNPSSGKMGYAIARAAEHRGALVTLISGPSVLPTPFNVHLIRIETAQEMADAVLERIDAAHIIIKTAAVADYRPISPEKHKIKKNSDELTLSLEKTCDILKEIGKRKRHQILVGFAAETQHLAQNAQKKLAEKNLDMIVGNLIGAPMSGFGTDTNQVTLFFKDGTTEGLPVMDKDEVAHILLDRIVRISASASNGMQE